jgi:hypothetical protein
MKSRCYTLFNTATTTYFLGLFGVMDASLVFLSFSYVEKQPETALEKMRKPQSRVIDIALVGGPGVSVCVYRSFFIFLFCVFNGWAWIRVRIQSPMSTSVHRVPIL